MTTSDRPGRSWRLPPFLLASIGLHGVALATLLVAPRAWKLAVGAVVANHLGIAVAGLLPRCGWLGPTITRLPPPRARENLLALTFDDGPDPEVTPAVLELLAAARARATFFCIGDRAEAHPDLVTVIRAHGHGVENHSYSHPHDFALRGPREMESQIRRAQEAIEHSGGGRPSFFRAPLGFQNPWLAPVLARAGLSLVSWTRRGYDTVTHDSVRVAGRLVRGLEAGDILLLHDGSSALGPNGRPVVLDALSRVLDEMSRAGLRSEALHRVLEVQAH
jgi:peptidoglycan/xylan/chitin deacetylase (PgdA/CDA1 family)